jgi:phosphogluconate dehydratase
MQKAPHDARIAAVTETIRARSAASRAAHLDRAARTAAANPPRKGLSCGNLAHAAAGCTVHADKMAVARNTMPNLGIVTAYNDMLSAHQPLAAYPDIIKEKARELGATAQVAGGVPAMCDGVTQGQPGMELSLFSRDVIAMATGVALSHNMFDAAVLLGVCDKIVPGLVMGALGFSHLPAIFVPAGPMPTGISNDEKNRVRQAYARGEATREELLDSEMASYHSPGTCTFYGTANSNQMLMEIMGLHVPGTAFVNPGTPLRDALTREAVRLALDAAANGRRMADIVDERAIVNAIAGLMATGGSTNHLLHLVAMAAQAGVKITWEDFEAISQAVPLIARVYPNGAADVNQFHAAGGIGYVIKELIRGGLVHADVTTIAGRGLDPYAAEPKLIDGRLVWTPAPEKGLEPSILGTLEAPQQATGGIKLVSGNLGRAVIKTSAVKADRHMVEAPARVFTSQEAFAKAFKAGELNRDVVVVVRFQGPKANGMPELHSLTPPLAVLQDKGFKVALLTDGRMSGASGKVLAAIHVAPEALAGGPIAKIRDGDPIRIDAVSGRMEAMVPEEEWSRRDVAVSRPNEDAFGIGRDMFAPFRAMVGAADDGASVVAA